MCGIRGKNNELLPVIEGSKDIFMVDNNFVAENGSERLVELLR